MSSYNKWKHETDDFIQYNNYWKTNISPRNKWTKWNPNWRSKRIINFNGPEGCPNNLQSAWHLAELVFWSDLSWSRADLWANSYVISTRFSLLSRFTLCTHYISYIGILRIIHNILFRISIIFDNMDMDYV